MDQVLEKIKELFGSSRLFDCDWYSKKYFVKEGMSEHAPIHYFLKGWRLGFNPSPNFSTQGYLEKNPDVASAGMCPLVHYLSVGINEGRVWISSDNVVTDEELAAVPDQQVTFELDLRQSDEFKAIAGSGMFDESFYSTNYPDVAENNMPPLDHFCLYGWKEGRRPNNDFDVDYYIARNEDVRVAEINPFYHWVVWGKGEGRKTKEVRVSRDLPYEKINSPSLIFISHEASQTGAPAVLLSLMQWLKENTEINFSVIIGARGVWDRKFENLAPCFFYRDYPAEQLREKLHQFCGDHVKYIYANTIVSGEYIPALDFLNAQVICHVHEMENVFQIYERQFSVILERCSDFIAVTEGSANSIRQRANKHVVNIDLLRPFITNSQPLVVPAIESNGKQVIFGCGTIEYRKGFDIFCRIGSEILKSGFKNFKMFWIGSSSQGIDPNAEIANLGLESYIEWLGPKPDPKAYFKLGDVFLLSSREDPFPLVCLEAASCGIPVVCFDHQATGIANFVGNDCGFVVPYLDERKMASAVLKILKNKKIKEKLGASARKKVLSKHTVDIAAREIFKKIKINNNHRNLNDVAAFDLLIDDYDVISFDIFDTLITRVVDDPNVVFDLIEYDCTKSQSAVISLIDERMHVAGKVLGSYKGKVDDITIDEIYESMSFFKDASLEKTYEIGCCVINPNGFAKYQSALKKNKKIILVSDMYLDEDTIKKILNKNSITGWSSLYLSSTYGEKKSTGALFRTVAKELTAKGYALKKILHFGDNWHGDVMQAKTAGIDSVRCVPITEKKYKSFPVAAKENLSQIGRIWNSFATQAANLWSENSALESREFFSRLGFEVTGPIAIMMAIHVYKQIKATGYKKVVFMARDGRIFKKAFDYLYVDDLKAGNISSLYLNLSRATVVPATLSHPLNANDLYFLTEGVQFSSLTVADYLSKAGLKNPSRKVIALALKQFGSLEYVVQAYEADLLVKLFKSLSSILYQTNKIHRDNLKSYLTQNELLAGSGFIVVDVGWYLNIHSRLAAFLESHSDNVHIHGCYIGSQARINKSLDHSCLLFKNQEPHTYAALIEKNTTLIELLFAAPEASAASLQFDGYSGKVVTRYKELSTPLDEEFLIAQKIHRGAEHFFRVYRDHRELLPQEASSDYIYALLHELANTENLEAIAQLSNFQVKLGGHHDIDSVQNLVNNNTYFDYVYDLDSEFFSPIYNSDDKVQQVVVVTSSGLKNGSTRYRGINLLDSLSAIKKSAVLIHASYSLKQAEKLIEAADYIIFQRCFDEQGFVKDFYEIARQHGKTCLSDIDDLVFPEFVNQIGSVVGGEWEVGQAVYVAKRYKEFMSKMDGNIASTPIIKDYFETSLGVKSFVLRNKVEEKYFLNKRSDIKEKIKIGYASGTFSHKQDFLLVADVIHKFLSSNSDVELHVLGAAQVPGSILGLANVFSHPLLPYPSMMEFFRSIDVLLVPLEDSLFNRAKSNLKFIEAAAVGTPVIASNLGEFEASISHGLNGYLANDLAEWQDILNEVASNICGIKKIGESAQRQVKEKFNTRKPESGFKEFFEQIVVESTGSSVAVEREFV